MVSKIAGVFLLFMVSSCLTRGQEFSSDTSWIKKNQTSQAEVRGRMGMPYIVGSSSGTPTWTYGHYKLRLLGESHTKELKFFWQKNRVKDFSFQSSFPSDRKVVLPLK